jgi:hypothetical protein
VLGHGLCQVDEAPGASFDMVDGQFRSHGQHLRVDPDIDLLELGLEAALQLLGAVLGDEDVLGAVVGGY